MENDQTQKTMKVYGAGQAKHYATFIIIPIFVLACVLIWQIVSMYRFESVYPQGDKRFDITQFYIATMSETCERVSLEVSAIEACLSQINTQDQAALRNKLHPFKIPSVEEIDPQAYPRYHVALREQNIIHIEDAYKRNEPVFLRFQVPRKFFTKNEIATDPYAVVFTQAPNGRLCIENDCSNVLDRVNYLSQTFPLIENEKLPQKDQINISIVYTERAISPFGINLEQGFFVTKLSDTSVLRSIHMSLIRGQSTIAGIVILMLFFVSLVMAMTWRQYLDYTAFALLLFFEAASRNINGMSHTHLLIDQMWFYTLADGLRVAVLCTSVLYAASTHRISARRFLQSTAAVILVTVAFSIGIHIYRLTNDILAVPRVVREIIIALKLIIAPIVAFAAWRFSSSYAKVSEKDRKRRTIEQSLIAGCLILYVIPEVLWILSFKKGLWTYDYSALTALAVFPLFAAMIYTTHGVLSTRVNEYHNEVSRLSGLAAIGSLAQMIAHDVRTPFSSLKTGLALIGRNPTAQADPKMQALVKRVSHEVDNSLLSVNAMLDDIMEVNRPNQLALSDSSVVTVISSCISPLRHRIQEKQIEVDISFGHEHKVLIDPIKMARVFSNIISNAVDMTPKGGTIRITTALALDLKHSDISILVSIFNSGSFIPHEDRSKLFQPFYTRRKKGGIGLGLSIVKKIMDAHPGSGIDVESIESLGTTFNLRLKQTKAIDTEVASFKGFAFLLPESESPSSEVIDGHEVAKIITSSIGTLRILMIDDEDIYSDGVRSTLQSIIGLQHAIDFRAAKDWQSVKQADLTNYHLIITDIDLKGSTKDGFEIIEELRDLAGSAFLCVHSNRSFPEDAARAFSAGADFMIPKPLAGAHALKILMMTLRKSTKEKPAA